MQQLPHYHVVSFNIPLQAWYMPIEHLSLYIESIESWYLNLLSTVSEFTSSCHALLHHYHEYNFPCNKLSKPELKLQCNRYPSNCVVVIICFSASSLNCNSNVSFLLFACHWLTSSKGLSGTKNLLPFPYQQVQDFLDSIHKRKLIAMEYPDFLQLKH